MWTQLSVLLDGWLRFLKDDAAEYKTPHESNMAATECWTTALFCSPWGPAVCGVCVRHISAFTEGWRVSSVTDANLYTFVKAAE